MYGKIVRNTVRVLAETPGRVRASRVEVAQRHIAETRVGSGEVGEQMLDDELGLSVRIGRGEAVRFGNRQARGSPYTVAEELDTMRRTQCRAIASSSSDGAADLLG